MADLRDLYTQLGFTGVKSYIQSGNVIFKSENNDFKELQKMIKDRIHDVYGYDVPVMVIDVNRLKFILHSNPFLLDGAKDEKYFHVTMVEDNFNENGQSAITEKATNGEEIVFLENLIYLYLPNGSGKSKISNNLFEQKLKAKTTTRNWRTMNKMLELAAST